MQKDDPDLGEIQLVPSLKIQITTVDYLIR